MVPNHSIGYLNSKNKNECYGCEACVQICHKDAISMKEDSEGFRYPHIDTNKCISCGKCNMVCPYEHPPISSEPRIAFGGYHKNPAIQQSSTSGGAFSAIVDGWCDKNYVIFGAAAKGLIVSHKYITDKSQINSFRKSKYSQSSIGNSYAKVKTFLKEGKKVLFSGTPCQIAGLKSFLGNTDQELLLTVEVICEGVPSPHFMRKYDSYMQKKYGSKIKKLDYRNKDKRKWDFQVMSTLLQNGRYLRKDRWFNPFWSIWLAHLMSRPCCYECSFATLPRVADITLGDLWGVHLYCPELYGKNGGASLVLCNTKKGKSAMAAARQYLSGHKLDLATACKYQSPLRKSIDKNPQRKDFMDDLLILPYEELCRKWAKKPTFQLLWSKYIWGNRQKVFVWNIFLSKVKK